MNNLDNLLERNKEFAAQQASAGTLMPSLPSALPNVKAIIIGCADMRVDPAHVLGIRPGEAVVMRNIGGRITPGLLQQLQLLGRIGEVAGEIPGGGGEFHLIVLQHTDCASLVLRTSRTCCRSIFKYRKVISRRKWLAILALPLPSTLLSCGRFQHCQVRGFSPAWCTTLQPGVLRSWYRRPRFVIRNHKRRDLGSSSDCR